MARTRGLVVAALLLAAAPAHAFCGFFVAPSGEKLSNDASQVALVRKGNRTWMSLANNYQGPAKDFAMVVPVPVVLQKEDVKVLPAKIFDHLDEMTAPRLVEYWEQDPCAPDPPITLKSIGTIGRGGGSGNATLGGGAHGVKVEAQFAVGEYEIVILSAKESGGLERWLRENHYAIPTGAAQALAPYVRGQMKFFVAKVDITKVKRDAQGAVQLSPLRVTYESSELRLPVRLGLLNANGKQDLLVYVLNPRARFEVANLPNVFIPTNLEVADEVRRAFAAFYAQLFDETLAAHEQKAVVTEYAWSTSTCDPCPGPTLTAEELLTLGGDPGPVTYQGGPGTITPQPLGPGRRPGDKPRAPPPFRGSGRYEGWVVTRLHARYDARVLSDDLVFREAPPVVGGRGGAGGAGGDDASTAVTVGQRAGANNFQGRYLIRHYWSTPAQCAQPRWSRWGGPPPNAGEVDADGLHRRQPAPAAARGLASAARGAVKLSAVVRTAVPALGIAGTPPPKHPPPAP